MKTAFAAKLITLVFITLAHAAEFPQPQLADINPAGIPGALVIVGGGELPDEAITQFRELVGGDDARLVVIPTAADNADSKAAEEWIAEWHERGFATVNVLHTRDRSVADTEEFAGPLKNATAVWFVGGQQSRISSAYVGTRVEQEIMALLQRGGVIGGTSAGAAIQSRLMIASGNPVANLMQGLDLLPGAVIDQHFKVRDREPRLTAVLEEHPGYFGIGIDEDTGIIVRGRQIEVVGKSTATVCFASSELRPLRQYELSAGDRADLTALRRAAIARADVTFPPPECPVCNVPNGALMIVGGGGFNEELRQRFVYLAGGESARIVVIPTASPNPPLTDRRDVQQFLDAGAASVDVLHTDDRAQADDEEFLKPLREATGVWFPGGRQWRIVDAYEGTATYDALHDVLRRGGVIGGSSAGATIQGEYLVRGNPLGNREMMAEGYERGFAFLPGAAIDQHFTQRGRLPDLASVKQTFPQLTGIGIDEGTALVVRESVAEVVGAGDVYIFDRPVDEDSDEATHTRIMTGQAYDFARKALVE